jgi:hypothetical protein
MNKPLTKKDEVDSTIVVPLTALAKSTIEIPIVRPEWKNKKAYLTEDIQSALEGYTTELRELLRNINKHTETYHKGKPSIEGIKGFEGLDRAIKIEIGKIQSLKERWFPCFSEKSEIMSKANKPAFKEAHK